MVLSGCRAFAWRSAPKPGRHQGRRHVVGLVEAHVDPGRHDLVDPVQHVLAEDVADYVAFIVTRPARVYIGEASPIAQFVKPLPGGGYLKQGI